MALFMSNFHDFDENQISENSVRDSFLSSYSIAKILFIPGSLDNYKMPFEPLFLDDPLTNTSLL